MGIVNVTPDSFSDGGEALRVEDAIARGHTMLDDGADILDIGGESTRPGADPVSIDEELSRVIPVIEGLVAGDALISIDTRRAAVMREAVGAGAGIINDVTALTGEGALDAAADAGVPVMVMHMQGEPQTMQANPTYDDAPRDICDYLAARIEACEQAGISRERIAVDPGIGFGKTLDHNLQIIARMDEFHALGCAVVLGASRKSFIGRLSGEASAHRRTPGSIAAALTARALGVQIFRVHDVAETRQALDVWEAINAAKA
ncbi:MAG: dihydropteroate synthase [Rhodospirillaceae bacterium]|nr:dihydropteroate synthase [Rhodospirillaceae bacterium]